MALSRFSETSHDGNQTTFNLEFSLVNACEMSELLNGSSRVPQQKQAIGWAGKQLKFTPEEDKRLV